MASLGAVQDWAISGSCEWEVIVVPVQEDPAAGVLWERSQAALSCP